MARHTARHLVTHEATCKLEFGMQKYCARIHLRLYLNQNSQAVKKECSPQKSQDEKYVKFKVAAKKWL